MIKTSTLRSVSGRMNDFHAKETVVQKTWRLLRRDIQRNYRCGDRMETVAELAERLEVSTNTVRAALDRLALDGWIRVRHGSGTTVTERASQLRAAILSDHDLLSPSASFFWREIARRIRGYLRDQGVLCRLYIGTSEYFSAGALTCWDFLEDAREGRIDAVAACATHDKGPWVEEIRRLGIPIVGSHSHYDGSVGIDSGQFMQEGLALLKDHGCKRVAFMGWRPTQRWEDARSFFDAAGLVGDAAWYRSDIPPGIPGSGRNEFRSLWSALDAKPDAIMIEDDILFKEFMVAVDELQIRVPQDLRVVTMTNRGSGIKSPFPVFSFECDAQAMAQAMGRMLIALARDEMIREPHVRHRLRCFESNNEDELIRKETA